MNEDALRKHFPNASTAFIRANATSSGDADLRPDSSGPSGKLERCAGNGTMGEVQVQAGLGRRFLVRVTSHRKRLLDEDNLCCKYLVDLCRYAGILPSDAPGTAKIEVAQQKTGPKEPERTTIEIFRL